MHESLTLQEHANGPVYAWVMSPDELEAIRKKYPTKPIQPTASELLKISEYRALMQMSQRKRRK